MTQQEIRTQILNMRLRLLAEYLDRFGNGNGPTFAQFIKRKGVSHAMFIKDLPPSHQDVPASGYDTVLEYALRLHDLLNGIHNLSEMEQIAADGNNLEAGNLHYQSNQYTPNAYPSDCGCGCNSDGENLNCCGADGEAFNAAGGCGLPPIPPPFPNPKKTNNSVTKAARKAWDKYKEKYAKYRRCINDNKAKGGYTLAEKAMRANNIISMGLMIPRVSFLKVVALNLFGLAQTFELMRKSSNQSHWENIKKKWYVLGGDLAKLDSNVSIGHSKKPVFKPKGWKPKGAITSNGADGSFSANGEWHNAYDWVAIGAMITAATGIITSMVPVIKSFKKDQGEPGADSYDPLNPGANVPEDTNLPDDTGVDGGGMLDNINWAIAAPIAIVVVIGLGFGIYKLTKSGK